MAITAEQVIQTFEEVRILNETVFEEWVNMTFGGPGSLFLPLSGGTMTGDIDMDNNEIIDALLNGITRVATNKFITSENFEVKAYFGDGVTDEFIVQVKTFFLGGEPKIRVGETGVWLESQNLSDFFLGFFNGAVPATRRLQFTATEFQLSHDGNGSIDPAGDLSLSPGGNMTIDPTGTLQINPTGNLGFFGAGGGLQQGPMTASDASAIGLIWTATEQGVLENVRTRVDEIESFMQTFGLFA